MRTLIDVEIFGQTFTLSSDQEEPEQVRALALRVHERMRTIASTGVSSPVRVAIMAALSFADDLQKAEANGQADRGGYR